jgi:hypothetical protein
MHVCTYYYVYIILSRSMSDSRRGFGLGNGFIDHIYTHDMRLHLKISAIANLHILQFTIAQI